jgi:hypothetical protein
MNPTKKHQLSSANKQKIYELAKKTRNFNLKYLVNKTHNELKTNVNCNIVSKFLKEKNKWCNINNANGHRK